MDRVRCWLTTSIAVGVSCVAALSGCSVLSDAMSICTMENQQHVGDLLGAVHTPATARAIQTTDVQCGDSLPSVHAASVFAVTGEEAVVVADLRAQLAASGWSPGTGVSLATYTRTHDAQTFWATITHDPLVGSHLVVTVTAGDAPWN